MAFKPTHYKKLGDTPAKTEIRPFKEKDFDAEARQVLDRAKARSAEIERRAYEQGFAKGERDGKKIGLDQIVPYLENFKRLGEQLAGSRERLLEEVEPMAVKLALAIASKVVKKEVADDKQTAARLTRDAVRKIVDRQKLIIHVSQTDHDLISELLPDILCMEGVKECSVVPDPNVAPGGCILETEGGSVDARIATALEEISSLAEEYDDD